MGTTGRTLALLIAFIVIVLIAFVALGPNDRAGPGTSASPGSTSGRQSAPASVSASAPAATGESPEGSRPPGSGGAPSQTAPVAVLVGAGDIAECDDDHDSATADLVEAVEGTVFTLGDNAYEDGTFAEFEECYGPTWGRPSIKGRTRPVPGNHEYQTRGAEGYFRYFGAAAGDPDEGWYAYDAGAWRIYALNSNCGEIGGCGSGSPQERWLREDLAANPRACVAAMSHHPRFSSGDHGNNDAMTDIWRALDEAGAELALAGHDHSYERFAPQDASGNPVDDGLVQLVVGTGGRDPYGFGNPKPNSLVRGSPVFGVLRLELRPDAYSFEFLPAPGTTFTDAGTGMCH